MTTKNIQDVVAKKVEEFDDRYVTKAGCIHALACTKEGTQGVKDWLTTTLTQLVKEVEEEEREDFKNYLKMLQGCEPDSIKVFITEKWYELESLTPTSDVTEK